MRVSKFFKVILTGLTIILAIMLYLPKWMAVSSEPGHRFPFAFSTPIEQRINIYPEFRFQVHKLVKSKRQQTFKADGG